MCIHIYFLRYILPTVEVLQSSHQGNLGEDINLLLKAAHPPT